MVSKHNALIDTYDKVDHLYDEMKSLLDEVALLQKDPDALTLLSDPTLKAAMAERKKQLKLTYEDLELQTGLSVSTLRRVLNAPENTSLGNFLKVAQELGIKTWFEK